MLPELLTTCLLTFHLTMGRPSAAELLLPDEDADSGAGRQCDPFLPPSLAAATCGIHKLLKIAFAAAPSAALPRRLPREHLICRHPTGALAAGQAAKLNPFFPLLAATCVILIIVSATITHPPAGCPSGS